MIPKTNGYSCLVNFCSRCKGPLNYEVCTQGRWESRFCPPGTTCRKSDMLCGSECVDLTSAAIAGQNE
uniref:Uncharacterized protein n=1 Tax=Romanomermis culicivorax TaxID=13658 RepID=A0A915KQ70_ROMCU